MLAKRGIEAKKEASLQPPLAMMRGLGLLSITGKGCGIVVHRQFQPTDSPSQTDRPKRITSCTLHTKLVPAEGPPPSPERPEVHT